MLLRIKLTYFADVIIILVCILGFYQAYEKAGLPAIFDQNGLTIEEVKNQGSSLLISDRLIEIDGISLSAQEELEFILDSKAIGQKVNIVVERNNNIIRVEERLTRFYSVRYIAIQIFVAALFIFLALFVFTKRKDDYAAQIFNWVLLFATLIIATTWGRFTIAPNGLGQFIRGVFNLAYASAAVFFIHFTIVFPSIKHKRAIKLLLILYFLSGLLTIVTTYSFLQAVKELDVFWFRLYNTMFNITRLYFVLCVFIGLFIVVHTYILAREESERRKLRWIILGLAVGPLSLIVLWIIPQIITSRGLVDEEYVVLTMLSVPIAFTISIVKYHILDIDQIFKRGTIYALVFFFVLFIYVALVSSITFFVGTLTVTSSLLASTLAAVIIAALFHPIKEHIQKFVNRKFFHVRYNYRLAEREFIEKIKYCYDENSLSETVVQSIENLIPNESTELHLVGHQTIKIKSALLDFIVKVNIPIALSEHIELGAKHERASREVFNNKNTVIMFRVYSESSGLLGLLSLGIKKSGFRYNLEDIDLLDSFCHQAALAIDRIRLQKKLISEQIEKTRLHELNELKSFFVSSVTHELKTPLTSIKMFTELIEDSPRLKKEKRDEYLEIIKGESTRLSRLIDNVLDITKIEKGIKEYRKSIINLNEHVFSVEKTLEYQLKLNGFDYEVKCDPNDLFIFADKDAVEEVLINLVSNSIKYSVQNKRVVISTITEKEYAILSVEDEGVGIEHSNLNKIFEPFERTNSPITKNTSGAGLGLALVKHIAEAHNAKLSVQSELGVGTKISIAFLLTKEEEK